MQNGGRRWGPTVTHPVENILVSTSQPVYKCYMRFFFNKDKISILQGKNYILQMQNLSHEHWEEILCASLVEGILGQGWTSLWCNTYQIMHFFFLFWIKFSALNCIFQVFKFSLLISDWSWTFAARCSAVCYGGTQSILQNLPQKELKPTPKFCSEDPMTPSDTQMAELGAGAAPWGTLQVWSAESQPYQSFFQEVLPHQLLVALRSTTLWPGHVPPSEHELGTSWGWV